MVRILPATAVRFEAGQYLLLGIEGVVRPYSVASPPDRPELEFFLEGTSGRIEPGCEVTLSRYGAGTMTLDDDRPHQLMIATVTGIAPFLSMIRHRLAGSRSDSIFYLLHGASFANEFALEHIKIGIAHAWSITDYPGLLPRVRIPKRLDFP